MNVIFNSQLSGLVGDDIVPSGWNPEFMEGKIGLVAREISLFSLDLGRVLAALTWA